MQSFVKCQLVIVVVFFSIFITACSSDEQSKAVDSVEIAPKNVLIFTKALDDTTPVKESREASAQILRETLSTRNINATVSDDSSLFNDANLKEYAALIFLNNTGDILTPAQQIAMERYIQAGGGFVGLHSASKAEQKSAWIWYQRLLGGTYKSHSTVPSNIQTARIRVLDKTHASAIHIPDNFSMNNEWLEFSNLSTRRTDILAIDSGSYNRNTYAPDSSQNSAETRDTYLPIAWFLEFDGGRSFYSGLGRDESSFKNDIVMKHILGGIEYAIGNNTRNYSLSRPEPNRFVKDVLLDKLNEPVSLDITKDGSAVVFVERKGNIHWVDVSSRTTTQIGNIDVFSAEGFGEFGLLALALDPNFDTNKHIFLMYNVASKNDATGPLQRISRYTIVDNKIDLSSQITLLDFANEDTCCHTGGNMEFDAEGNLFIAIGDNTNPFKSFGVGPADFRDGREAHDAYRSSANTQDFRGKILRITPQSDGTYTIPKGNLFTDATIGKPEIYVMGTRNPYTIAFDNKEKTLYYGDVGPDSKGANAEHGAKGYDEVNKVTKAGNFGWPLFIGNNKAFRQFDYATNIAGAWNNPLKPINTSPRNTGARHLPEAQPAYIWYPYSHSEIFPELGAGSRNALVAGVYRSNSHADALPEYYDGGLFISDFMRRWIKVVFEDENGDIYKIEDFAPDAEFVAPIDLKFSYQGQLYVLEYGSKWHSGNVDARLSKITYTGDGNREPTAKLTTSVTNGLAPLMVKLSGVESFDPDNDRLEYQWQTSTLNAGQDLKDATFTNSDANTRSGHTTSINFENNGRYAIALTVTDKEGLTSIATQLIEVGNASPTIDIKVSGNQSFIWPNETSRTYTVAIQDSEDGIIRQDSPEFSKVEIVFDKVDTSDKQDAVGHLAASDPMGPGRAAAKKHLCIGCHQEQAQSVGPAFQAVADKYASMDDPVAYLVKSIAAGSTGKWGQHQMPAHDFLSDEKREELAKFIMMLKSKAPSLPLSGKLPTKETLENYTLKASYRDNGAANLSSVSAHSSITLRSPKLSAKQLFDNKEGAENLRYSGGNAQTIIMSGAKSVLPLGSFDMTGVSSIQIEQKYRNWLPKGAIFSVSTQQDGSDVLASGKFDYAGTKEYQPSELRLKFTKTLGENTPIYLVVTLAEALNDDSTAHITAVQFLQ